MLEEIESTSESWPDRLSRRPVAGLAALEAEVNVSPVLAGDEDPEPEPEPETKVMKKASTKSPKKG